MNAAVQIMLGARPKNFTKAVECDTLDGKRGVIKWNFTYRTRTELAELVDEMQAARKMQIEAEIEAIKKAADTNSSLPEVTAKERNKQDIATNVDMLLKAADGWDLPFEFNRASLEQLADEVPAAVTAAIATYRDAISEGRLGN